MKRQRESAAGTSGNWVCPVCRRRFARARQWHSCQRQTIESHFAGKDPELRRAFDVMVRRLEASGPLRTDAVKTSIHLISRHHFGGVRVQHGSLRVGFLASRPISSARIVGQQRLGPSRVEHTVVVRTGEDLDAELVGWLRSAQRLMS
jgi:hypothetical protein